VRVMCEATVDVLGHTRSNRSRIAAFVSAFMDIFRACAREITIGGSDVQRFGTTKCEYRHMRRWATRDYALHVVALSVSELVAALVTLPLFKDWLKLASM
jgi:hypothetical protein